PPYDANQAQPGSFWGGLRGLVEGEHAYAAAGSYDIHVTITGPGGASADATSTATVTTATIKAEGISFDATTNQADIGQTVAVFSPASTNDSPDGYKAAIDWGDGTTSDGTVSLDPVILYFSGANDGA